ncbi:MAG TPA: cupin domain-containing protein [Kineosporiaceae bacterium]|jgi:mannose-6-phosphate isomerase-like protein (cupin superfamily)|nr:cupin domain-containing protein [Kineosporiaceae bacterium]
MLTDPAVRPDRALVGQLRVGVGGRVAAPHTHPVATERFRVIGGQIGFQIGADRRVLGPGDQAEVPPGVVHDWWQVGDQEAEVIVDMQPGDRFTEILTTFFGLVRDGQVNKRGLPHLLQLAVTAHSYRDAMVFKSPPPWLQRALFAGLTPIGRALGRRPSYPRYATSDQLDDPDPLVLRLLDEHGRLRWEHLR